MTDIPTQPQAIPTRDTVTSTALATIDLPLGAPPTQPNDQYDAQANAIIAAGVASAAAMGWLPSFIDVGWLVMTNGGMITSLALLYRHKWTADNTKSFIGRLIGDSGVAIVSVKALAALIELTGIGLPVGIAMNGALNGGITLALGKSAQHYFKNQGDVPDDELIKLFKDTLNLKQFLR